MIRNFFLVFALCCQAQAMEVGRVTSNQELLESAGRSNWGKPQKVRQPERLVAGSRVLVLFHQDGMVAVIGARLQEHHNSREQFGYRSFRAGYLPEEAVVAEYPGAVDLAIVHDKDGRTNVRSGPGNDQPVLTTIKTEPEKGISNCVFVLERGEWNKVVIPSGQVGYIHQSRLEPLRIDVGDDPDKRALAEAILLPRLKEKPDPRDQKIVRREAYVGCDLYYAKPGATRLEHRYTLGLDCRYQNWAHLVANARTQDGHWAYFGGVPTHLMERVGSKWVERGQAYDGSVAPKVLPENVRLAFRLDLSKR